MNNVTKTQLKDFVDSKITKRKQELRQEIEASITASLGDKLKTLLGDTKELERVASKFEDLLTEKIHIVGSDSVPSYASITASNANKLCKAHKYFLDELVGDAMDALLNARGYRFKSVPLMETFKTLSAELQPKVSLFRTGLETLKTELHNAISNESKGKQAYNSLVALGVDMSDMPEANPMLPAVVKLSVDVCLMNGNCEEKSA